MLNRLAARLLVVVIAAMPAGCARHAPPSAGPPPPPPPAAAAASAPAPAPAPAPLKLPERLSNEEFWTLVNDLSEPNGYFRSDNLLSNEVWLQYVIPDLLAVAKPGRVYMGVGPEQNFTYIAALKPAMVFITDVRRGNLDLHLMYKALFETSADRAEFVGKLFSRPRPEGLTAASTVRDIFRAYAAVAPDQKLYDSNYKAIIDHLQKTRKFALTPDDAPGIEYVYQYFFKYGPDLTYWMSGGMGGRGGRNSPTYADLMVATDESGTLRGYLASEENFTVLKSLHTRNLFVPIVGNFAGPKALRAVGAWLKKHNAMVSAFYLSNVEQYLNMDGIWMDFCRNASELPIDDSSQFIRSYRGPGPGFGGGASLAQGIFPMVQDLKLCQ
ncbi:MAG TPA: hypothetical protein VFK57_06150 [Vicinamibacterales bacterium]|nr:hypothetical protein [Vicinamibacterales bacterium]